MTKKLSNADEPNWGLFYREHRKDLNERKSIKVKLPIRQHIRLHAMKLFTENNISETVERALDQYFTELKDEDAAVVGGTTAPNGVSVNGAVGADAATDAAGGIVDGVTTDASADAADDVAARSGASRARNG